MGKFSYKRRKGMKKQSFKNRKKTGGTNHEKELGKPASMGCIRMSNRDILEVYELLSIGDKVLITE